MSYLSKKDRKYVSKLITEKLLSMGVKDEITYVKSGKVKYFYKKDVDGKIITETDKDGKISPKLIAVDMPIAINVLRRTVREMRNKPPEVINSFLEMSPSGEGK